MEFIDGITVCSDCGGPLVASREEADAIKRREREMAEAAAAASFAETMQAAMDEAAADEFSGDDPSDEAVHHAKAARISGRPQVYVKKSQQYDDFKSSAFTFFLIGAAALIIGVSGCAGILPLPMTRASRILPFGIITLMGAASLAVAISSKRSADKIHSQVKTEEDTTRRLTTWFIENYTAARLDARITNDYGELAPEELSLKRLELIQDLLITSHDLPDQNYADLLAEEIYGKLYDN